MRVADTIVCTYLGRRAELGGVGSSSGDEKQVPMLNDYSIMCVGSYVKSV